MKNWLFFLGFIFFSALIAFKCVRKETENLSLTKPVVKIGVMLPLSGDNAMIGKPLQGAVILALEDVNQKDNKYHYQAIFEDTVLSSSKTAMVVSKLINYDHIDAILSYGANVGNVVSKETEKSKIIHIGLSSSPTVAKGKYNFINWTAPQSEAQKMAEIIKQKGYRRITQVVTNHEGAVAASEMLTQELGKQKIENKVLLINPHTADMRLDIAKLEEVGTDLYILILYSPDNQIFIKQLRERGSQADITAIETFNFFYDFSIIEGAWYIDGAAAENAVMEKIKKYNKSAATYGVGNFYDNIILLSQAYEKAENKNFAIEELLKIKSYNGSVGLLQQDEKGIFHSRAVVKKIIKGKPTVVETEKNDSIKNVKN